MFCQSFPYRRYFPCGILIRGLYKRSKRRGKPESHARLQKRSSNTGGDQRRPVYLQTKPAIICNIRDISRRLAADTEIQKHRTLDSIAALSGGIAHHYNNLLTAIIGNIAVTDEIASLPAGNYVKISITDQGKGIPSKESFPAAIPRTRE